MKKKNQNHNHKYTQEIETEQMRKKFKTTYPINWNRRDEEKKIKTYIDKKLKQERWRKKNKNPHTQQIEIEKMTKIIKTEQLRKKLKPHTQ